MSEATSQRLAGTGCSSAEICRQMGWVAGQYVESVNPDPVLLRLTAIGEELVLGRVVLPCEGQWIDDADESLWDLRYRAWRKADDPMRGAGKDEG